MKPLGWKIGLYFALVFAGGVAVGSLGHRYFTLGHPPHADQAPGGGGAERFREQMVQGLTTRLHLDTGQVAKLEKILDDSRDDFRSFRECHKDEVKAILDKQTGRIEALLTPDQLKEYKKIEKERDEQMKRTQKNDR
jgi:hypothetical protein